MAHASLRTVRFCLLELFLRYVLFVSITLQTLLNVLVGLVVLLPSLGILGALRSQRFGCTSAFFSAIKEPCLYCYG